MRPEEVRAQQMNARVREREALRLRLAGLTYAEIAERLGYSRPASAYVAVQRALAKICPPEDVAALRQLEIQRLDQLLQSRWEKALAGDDAALDRVLRILERKARLLGLDAPEKRQVEASLDRATWEALAPWLFRDSDGPATGEGR